MRRRRAMRRAATWSALAAVLVAAIVLVGRLPRYAPAGAIGTPAQTEAPTAIVILEPTEVAFSPTPAPTPPPTPIPTPTPVPTPAPTPVRLKLPYYVVVDRSAQTVTVYTINADGAYTLPVRTMLCSTDKFNRKPPNGVYKLDGERKRWLLTVATPRSYAQYATRIASKILFHSIPYVKKSAAALDQRAYGDLGDNASIGCIRLLCADAKWIYDNLPKGTPVRFIGSEPDGSAISNAPSPPPLGGGKWDPTDPDPNNPDYDPSYAELQPQATPWLGVTPAPTKKWKASTYK
ncbi:MAG: L,D-transpeptidase [Clostridiales bacterium]|nr:L,D-transpeptidase [Clostridiales bacterium]